MGRKSAAKSRTESSLPPPPEPRRSKAPMVAAAIGVAAIAVAVVYLRSGATADPGASAGTAAPAAYAYAHPITKAHPQANLPPLQFPGYPTARPPEVIRAAYQFAAEHPEVLSYVPCFCGCERSGHRGNEDCFVRERDVNGDVVAWDDHGMECAICLDVAERSSKLFASGASVKDIRSAIEKEFGSHAASHTPTPLAP
jgi:Protein of unknown function with PCYCGC motif